jgi:hypothetical protein
LFEESGESSLSLLIVKSGVFFAAVEDRSESPAPLTKLSGLVFCNDEYVR